MKKLILSFLLLSCSIYLHAQVGIGTETPNASAILDVTSTSQGVLLPRMTTTQRDAIASPAAGLVVFNTTTNCINMFTGSIWNELCGTATQGTIATLNCSPTNNGTLTANTLASSVSSVFSYTGGNNITHNGQTVTSTGVTGLTATLASGTMSSAGGTLTYNITGTPSGSGTASFAINIGGKTCTLSRTVFGTVATINCSGTTNGTLTSGTAASSVSSVISYTGGNAGTHNGQTVTSTGVTGLTATLTAGTFASGNGTLTYNITGTPSAAGTATFAISIGGQTCSLTRTVVAATVACLVGATTVVDVVNATTGKTWMDRNLGAHQAATSSTDEQAYGDLYQFGRSTDGHQCRNSSTTNTQSSSNTAPNSSFILGSGSWRTTTTELWTGISGVNNPCPTGYRIPTSAEITAETSSWSAQSGAGAFANNRKWTMSGSRDGGNNTINNLGTMGFCWTSTPGNNASTSVNFLMFGPFVSQTVMAQTNGLSVRCIKN